MDYRSKRGSVRFLYLEKGYRSNVVKGVVSSFPYKTSAEEKQQ